MRSSYLDYSGSLAGQSINISGVADFLGLAGFNDSPFTRTRLGDPVNAPNIQIGEEGTNYCDFCMTPLMGGDFERLADGRERCMRCSETAISTRDQFVALFMRAKKQMELVFEIDIAVAMQVSMVNAREIAKGSGETFEATPGFDGRTLGYAVKSSAGYSLHVENGAPALALLGTTIHELTHIWQYINWDRASIERVYGKDKTLCVYEGMATWAQIQYLYSTHATAYAQREEAYTEKRSDEYGIGFRAFREKYSMCRDGVLRGKTPFKLTWPL